MDGASSSLSLSLSLSLYLSIQKNTPETPGGGQHEPENQYTETIFLTDHHPLNPSKRTPVICNLRTPSSWSWRSVSIKLLISHKEKANIRGIILGEGEGGKERKKKSS